MPSTPGVPIITSPAAPPVPTPSAGGSSTNSTVDVWAAFGTYTVLFLIAGGTGETGRVAEALAWSIALVVGIRWIMQLQAEGRPPFGNNSFWR